MYSDQYTTREGATYVLLSAARGMLVHLSVWWT